MMSNNLPALLTPLLGRERETATLYKLLYQPEVRLVTITGPGGVGKTSLALQVAYEIRDAFHDGVFFISLAPINDPTLLIPTIAQLLGVTEFPSRLLLNSLKDFLRDKQILLLLDNFEQIIFVSPLLTELLEACARLKILVTSREALRLRGEHEFPLAPLALPVQPTFKNLLQYPGIALFVERAQAIQPGFQLAPDNAQAVAEICTHLDGLPLAIELAAARIKLLPPQAMLAHLRDAPLQLLTGGARDLPARQQTLRGTIQWSYDLLNVDEQRVFRWLSVFVYGCTFAAAKAICGQASLDRLGSLLNKSLLVQHETGHSPRLTMLDTIREFGLDELTRTHELEAARRAHATYYLSFTEEAEPNLTGADQKIWIQQLNREQDNLRAALQWAIEHHEGELAQRMAGALQPFWLTRGYWSEGRRWLEESLACDPGAIVSPSVHARTLYATGILTRFQGDFVRARILLEQSLTLYRALADQPGVLMTIVELSRITAFQGDKTAKKAFLAEAASLLETLPDTVMKASAYSEMATAMVNPNASQYPPEAVRYLAESERIHRAQNNPTGLALVLIRQGSSALFGGDYSLVESRLAEAEHLAKELGDERILSRLAGIRVIFDWQADDFAAIRLRLQDTFQQAANRDDHQFFAFLPMLAAVLHGQGLEVWSARVFGLVEAMTGIRPISAEAVALWQFVPLGDILAEVRALLGDEAFDREIAAGRRLTLDDLWAIPHSAPPPAALLPTPGETLTAREIEVIRLLAQELSNPLIAERLVVSRRTVDAHLRSIYDKLGVKSRDAAVRVAGERGLISNH